MNRKITYQLFISALLLFFLVITNLNIALCQEKIDLSLDKAIEISLAQSPTVKSVLNALRRDGKRVVAARKGLKSNAHCEFFLPNFDESIKEEYDSEAQLYKMVRTQNMKYEGRIRINQPIITDGNLSLNGSFLSLKQFNEKANFKTNLFFEFSQPIFTSSRIKREIKRAELNFEQTELEYIGKWVNHIFSIKSVFYQIFRYSYNAEIDRQEVQDATKAYNQASDRYKVKEIDKLSLNQIKINMLNSKQKLLNSERVFQDYKAHFKQLIGIPLNTEIEVKSSLEYIPVSLNINESIEQGINNSTELRMSKISRELNRLLKEEVSSRREFKGELTVTYGMDNSDDVFESVFNNFDKSKSVLLTFTIPLWDWGKNKADVNAILTNITKIDNSYENRRQAIKERITNQVSVTRQSLNRLAILKKSEETAGRGYQLTLDKFNKNEVSSQDMIQSQNRLTYAKKSYLYAYVEYRNSLIDLERDTYWDVENNRNLLEETKNFMKDYINNDFKYYIYK